MLITNDDGINICVHGLKHGLWRYRHAHNLYIWLDIYYEYDILEGEAIDYE
jgi:hypothetical protein